MAGTQSSAAEILVPSACKGDPLVELEAKKKRKRMRGVSRVGVPFLRRNAPTPPGPEPTCSPQSTKTTPEGRTVRDGGVGRVGERPASCSHLSSFGWLSETSEFPSRQWVDSRAATPHWTRFTKEDSARELGKLAYYAPEGSFNYQRVHVNINSPFGNNRVAASGTAHAQGMNGM